MVKVQGEIDPRNQIIQAKKSTIHVEVSNLESLVTDIQSIRDKWKDILREAKVITGALNIPKEFPEKMEK